jgi:hypothetical protein
MWIVVRDARRHAAQMRKRARVPVEKADLILPLVDPAKIPTGVHQAQDKEPRLPALAGQVDQHLEEIDFGQIAGAVRQRNHHFPSLPLPLGDGLLDDRDPDGVAFPAQELV